MEEGTHKHRLQMRRSDTLAGIESTWFSRTGATRPVNTEDPLKTRVRWSPSTADVRQKRDGDTYGVGRYKLKEPITGDGR